MELQGVERSENENSYFIKDESVMASAVEV